LRNVKKNYDNLRRSTRKRERSRGVFGGGQEGNLMQKKEKSTTRWSVAKKKSGLETTSPAVKALVEQRKRERKKGTSKKQCQRRGMVSGSVRGREI